MSKTRKLIVLWIAWAFCGICMACGGDYITKEKELNAARPITSVSKTEKICI